MRRVQNGWKTLTRSGWMRTGRKSLSRPSPILSASLHHSLTRSTRSAAASPSILAAPSLPLPSSLLPSPSPAFPVCLRHYAGASSGRGGEEVREAGAGAGAGAGVGVGAGGEQPADALTSAPSSPYTTAAEEARAMLADAEKDGTAIQTLLSHFDDIVDADPHLWSAIVRSLDPASRQALFYLIERNRAAVINTMKRRVRLVEREGMMRWEEIQTWSEGEFEKMDVNSDGVITREEFYAFLKRKREESCSSPSLSQLTHLAVLNGVPFIGFGFLDNAIMIGAGEYIDYTIGLTLGLSTMAAAALGNLLSDVAGVGMGGTIEAFASKLGIPETTLSQAQQKTRAAMFAKGFGSAFG
eukprot:CAMPEP_0113894860 /NCGR_PEP_ID=MMETSP0780_2-20120614/16996_1 /TAXON_ID=652834 /ORGANISM="Palpitomonas bilix" /LENGTH=354 /DNA_ID=CAMNT_0000885535 /DNA_START=384 /DNA_END=1444 /DNA_ORIENTATION=- /assembly_acc=CAM_ASM_000599